MSALVTILVHGDTDKFRDLMARDPDRFRAIADDARSRGAIHHRFGVGDGYVLAVDEWETAEAFQTFFQTNADIPTLMAEAGAQSEPQITLAEAIESPDQF
jgi:hypothetical protein